MLDIQGGRVTLSRGGMSRRTFVRAGALGMAGLTLADWIGLKALGGVAKEPKALTGRATRQVQWLNTNSLVFNKAHRVSWMA